MGTQTYRIEGMSCGGCSGKMKRLLERLPAVELAEVSHEDGSAVLTVVPGEHLDATDVAEVVEKAGYALVD